MKRVTTGVALLCVLVLLFSSSGCSGGQPPGSIDGGADGAVPADGAAGTDASGVDAAHGSDGGISADAAPDGSLLADGSTSTDAGAPVAIDDTGVPSEAALYTLDGTRYGIREVGAALDAVASGPSVEHVILYVHGRGCGGGGEPGKSLDGAMPEMARDYDAVPIMVYWPGSDSACPLGFPTDRALAAGPALAVVAGDLHRWELEHPARRTALSFTLITHSMGNQLLEGAAGVSGVSRLPPSLFDVVVVNSGASAADGHEAWLSEVHFGAAIYVTVNNGDRILRLAGFGSGTRLGRNVDDVGLTSGVTYVDFTANDVNHAYYLIGGQNGAAMTAFYRAIMNGRSFDFAASSGVDAPITRDGATIYPFNGG